MKQNVKTAKQLIKLAKQLIADGEDKIEQLKLELPTQQLEKAGDEAANAFEELNDVGEQIQEQVEDTFEEIQDELDEQEKSAKRIMKACKTASIRNSFQKRYAMQREEKEEMLKTAMDIHNNLTIAAQKFVNAVETYHDVKVYAKKLKKAKINKVAWGVSFLKGLFQKHPDVEESLENKGKNSYLTMRSLTKKCKKGIINAYNKCVETFNNVRTKIHDLVQGTITKINNLVTQAIGGVTSAWNTCKETATQIGKEVAQIGEKVAQIGKKVGTFVYELGKESAIFVGKFTLGTLFIAIAGPILAVIAAAKALAFVGKVLGDAFKATMNEIIEKLKYARDYCKSVIESFGKFSIQCKTDVENKIAEIKELADNKVDEINEWTDDKIDEIENAIETKIEEIVATYKKYGEKALQLGKQIQDIVKTPYYVIKDGIKGIIDEITEQVDE